MTANEDQSWREKSVSERVEQMLVRKIECDVQFVFTDEKGQEKEESVRAHKFMLMAASKDFVTRFDHPSFVGNIKVTNDLEFGRAAIANMLTFIYSDRFPPEESEQMEETFMAANYYGVTALEQHCFDALLSDMDEKNVFIKLKVAQRSSKVANIEKVLKFVDLNAAAVIASEGFLKSDAETVKMLLHRNLKADEFLIFAAVKQWAELKCREQGIANPSGKQLRQMMGPLHELIRFPLIEVEVLATSIKESGVLEQDILLNLLHWKMTKDETKKASIDLPFSTVPRFQ